MPEPKSSAELSFICALMCENDALEHEYLAQVAERAKLEYKLGNVLRLVSPDLYRSWAKKSRESAEYHLQKACSLTSATNTNS